MGLPSIHTVLNNATVGGGIDLRHPTWSEFEEWVELRRSNMAYLKPWEPTWSEEHLTRASYKTRLVRFKKMVANDDGYPFHVFRSSDNALVGACNITDIRRKVAQDASLGYWVGEDYTRQGYARAAVRAVSQFAFEQLNLHRLEAAIQTDNTPSIRVIEAVGFHKEGLARGLLKINGVWRDHMIYARLTSDIGEDLRLPK